MGMIDERLNKLPEMSLQDINSSSSVDVSTLWSRKGSRKGCTHRQISTFFGLRVAYNTCADPESFGRGGPP